MTAPTKGNTKRTTNITARTRKRAARMTIATKIRIVKNGVTGKGVIGAIGAIEAIEGVIEVIEATEATEAIEAIGVIEEVTGIEGGTTIAGTRTEGPAIEIIADEMIALSMKRTLISSRGARSRRCERLTWPRQRKWRQPWSKR